MLLQLIIHPDVESMALMMCMQVGMCGFVRALIELSTLAVILLCVKRVGVY